MPKITELWAYIADSGDGDEGVIAAGFASQGQTHWMPLMGADFKRMETLLPKAIEIQAISKASVRLIKCVLPTPRAFSKIPEDTSFLDEINQKLEEAFIALGVSND